MKNHDAGTDEFIQHFNDFPLHRQNIIAGFIQENGRLLLNIPWYGPARLISARLREGPFSGFYEFEKGLARTLHPVLAGLNLNIIADILTNGLFSEKYHFYARDINYILASNKKLEPDALKNVILGMVERDGHYMVVKFYDLVLRLIDANLWKELKSAELCLIEMKKNLGSSASENSAAIVKIYNTYKKTQSVAAERLLLKRAEWDQELKKYLLQPEDETAFMGITGEAPAGAPPEDESGAVSRENGSGTGPGPDEEAGESVAEASWGDRVTRYAALIKEGYLIRKEPLDEQGIRSIVEGMAVKNEKVSGRERAADIVRDVLALWVEDETLDEETRGTLARIRDERRGTSAPEENHPMEEGEQTADEADVTAAGAMEEDEMTEGALFEDKDEPLEAGVSDEEMSAILNGISDEHPEQDEPSEAETGREAPEQGDDEKFLIGEDEVLEPVEEKSHPDSGTEGSFLIDDLETEDEIPDEVPEKISADQDFIKDMIAADEFVIQDELLYEDKSLEKNRKNEKRPDDE